MSDITPDIIKVILDSGISVLLALVVIYWYRTDNISQIKLQKERSDEERNDKLLALKVIQENTNAITNNSNTIERVLDICYKINDRISRM